MTKEEWIKVRKEPNIPLGVWFSYYKENGGDIDDPIEFEKYFDRVMDSQPTFLLDGRLVTVNPLTARDRLHDYYNEKFEVYEP